MSNEPGARGLLFLVVGPSGSGKDSLIYGAQESLRGNGAFVFARRVITRDADAVGEDHIPASADDFEQQVRDGAFLLHWRANGHGYGLPRGLDAERQAGRHVVANVSRTVVPEARSRLAGC